MKMKPLPFASSAFLSALLIPASLHAIEAPEDNAPPPAQAGEPAPAAAATAFLGLISQPLPDVLREHLNLGDQKGVIISSVIPGGPADKAGLGANDIITGIDDKKITTPEELSAVIGTHKPGDDIRISTIQKGKPAEQKATLGERPAHIPMAARGQLEDMAALEGLPDELAERIRRMVEQNAGGFEIPMAPMGGPIPVPELDAELGKLRNQMRMEFGIGGNGLNIQQGATFRMMDDTGSIEMKSEGDSKEVTVRDKDNNIIWNGPWDTEQDKAAAPEDVRKRIERLNIDGHGGQLRLNMRPR